MSSTATQEPETYSQRADMEWFIKNLAEEDSLPELSDDEINQLNAGLDEVINAIDRLSAEFRASIQALQVKVAA